MFLISLRFLESRLNQEAPALDWKCEALSAQQVSGTNVPEEIQVLASSDGTSVKGSAFYLSGECLLRWGVDRSASVICNEMRPCDHASRHSVGLDWDRLADL